MALVPDGPGIGVAFSSLVCMGVAQRLSPNPPVLVAGLSCCPCRRDGV